MFDKLEDTLLRYEEVLNELSEPDVLNDQSRYQKLMPEVQDHEPVLALDGREDGLYFYRKIIELSPSHLADQGMLAFEIGYDQGESVAELMRKKGFQQVEVKKDLAGLDRIVTGHICHNGG